MMEFNWLVVLLSLTLCLKGGYDLYFSGLRSGRAEGYKWGYEEGMKDGYELGSKPDSFYAYRGKTDGISNN